MTRVIERINRPAPTAPKLIRVAAYARVSSGKDAMLHSLSAQVSYYNDLIQKHPGWLFCGVYADEALTGTKDTREQFQKLLADCRAGMLDLVVTKSISRFARNTLTLLETVRELKAFAKTELLQPGQSQKLTMDFSNYDLATFYHEDSAWKTIAGTYIVEICEDAETIKISMPLRIKDTTKYAVNNVLNN